MTAEKKKKKMGRPSMYTPELAQEICEKLSMHTGGLQGLCDAHDHFPDPVTIRRWALNRNDFCLMYARARAHQSEFMLEQVIDISDDDERFTRVTKDGERVADPGRVAQARLQIDTRKWLATKLVPRKYGLRYIDEKVAEAEELKAELEELRAQLAEKSKKDY